VLDNVRLPSERESRWHTTRTSPTSPKLTMPYSINSLSQATRPPTRESIAVKHVGRKTHPLRTNHFRPRIITTIPFLKVAFSGDSWLDTSQIRIDKMPQCESAVNLPAAPQHSFR